jgi:hypothetical protein
MYSHGRWGSASSRGRWRRRRACGLWPPPAFAMGTIPEAGKLVEDGLGGSPEVVVVVADRGGQAPGAGGDLGCPGLDVEGG